VGAAGRESRVAVYGMGYVGKAVAAVMLRAGFRVVGVDVSREKVEELNRGSVRYAEAEVREAIARGLREGAFKATVNGVEASRECKVKIVTVPVYLDRDFQPDFSSFEAAVKAVGRGSEEGDLVVVESSVPPGTTLGLVKPALEEASGLKVEEQLLLAYSPERVYVGRAVKDIEERYPKVVAGVGPRSAETAAALYSKVAKRGVVVLSSPTAAELEAANTQPYCHLHMPGVGVGGYCIPVYPRFLAHAAAKLGLELPLVELARRVNLSMPGYTADLVDAVARRLQVVEPKVAILGLAFRGGVDDTRLSPTYDLLDALLKKGYGDVVVHDPHVERDAQLEALGVRLERNLEAALKGRDIAVVATDHPEYAELTLGRLKGAMGRERVGVVDGRLVIEDWRTPPPGVVYAAIGRPIVANL
jgi:UDP-N-acetyl-D-mannosaminuronate dehydrogenase